MGKIKISLQVVLFLIALNVTNITPAGAAEALDNSLKLLVSRKSVEFDIFDQKIGAELSTLGLSWNHTFRHGFVGVNLEQTLQDDTVAVDQGHGSLSREDYSLVLGYNATSWLSIFGGYLYGDTEAQIRDFNTVPAFASEVHIRHRGPYAGLGFNYAFGNGALGLNVAYAYMEGAIINRPLTQQPGDESVTSEGTTTGFSYGLSWVGELDRTMTYSLGVKVNRYKFDDDDLAYTNGSGEQRDSSTRESFTIISFAVSRYF